MKERFFRLYAAHVSPELKGRIANIEFDGDNKIPPGVYKIIAAYKTAGCKPSLDAQWKRVKKVYGYRNHATHGRPLPPEVIDEAVEAVAALDELHTVFEPASAGVGH